jgi:hypothetical protein
VIFQVKEISPAWFFRSQTDISHVWFFRSNKFLMPDFSGHRETFLLCDFSGHGQTFLMRDFSGQRNFSCVIFSRHRQTFLLRDFSGHRQTFLLCDFSRQTDLSPAWFFMSEKDTSHVWLLLNSLTSKVGTISCPETSVRNYHHTLPNMQEELRSQTFLTPPKRPDRHWGPPSVLFNGSRGSFAEVKRKDLNAEVSDKVQLYAKTTHAVLSWSWIQWKETHIITLNKHGSCATDIWLWAPAGTSTTRRTDRPSPAVSTQNRAMKQRLTAGSSQERSLKRWGIQTANLTCN